MSADDRGLLERIVEYVKEMVAEELIFDDPDGNVGQLETNKILIMNQSKFYQLTLQEVKIEVVPEQ
jgi:hypothetical protein